MNRIKRFLKRVQKKIAKIRWKFSWRSKIPLHSSIQIIQTGETLRNCTEAIVTKSPGAYMRFGDGDVFLSLGKNDMHQIANVKFAQEMHEALAIAGTHILKSLAIHSAKFGYEKGMCPGVHLVSDKFAEYLLRNSIEYFVGSRIYSPVALHHIAVMDMERCLEFLQLLKKNTFLFVGLGDIEGDVKSALFGRSNHVKTPSSNSYSEIDRITNEALHFLREQNSFGVTIVAMGCAGRVMAKRLLSANVNTFIFDFGSLLDALCARNTRKWIEKTHFGDLERKKIINRLARSPDFFE